MSSETTSGTGSTSGGGPLCAVVLAMAVAAGCPPRPPAYSCELASEAASTPPRPIYLMYADGTTSVPNGGTCGGVGKPPQFRCLFPLNGDPDSCARQVQGFLDRFFEPYNVYFTLTAPAQGPFDTIVVTTGNRWCSSSNDGEALLSCSYRESDSAYALRCDADPKKCAVLIAHEYGHLVGLADVTPAFLFDGEGEDDIMHKPVCTWCDGFVNASRSLADRTCGREWQNSHELLCKALGPRSNAPLPSDAFTCVDASPPTLTVTQPAEGATVPTQFAVVAEASDDCGVRAVSARVEGQEESGGSDNMPPYGPGLRASAGPATVIVTATDNRGNETSLSLHVDVVESPPPGPP